MKFKFIVPLIAVTELYEDNRRFTDGAQGSGVRDAVTDGTQGSGLWCWMQWATVGQGGTKVRQN